MRLPILVLTCKRLGNHQSCSYKKKWTNWKSMNSLGPIKNLEHRGKHHVENCRGRHIWRNSLTSKLWCYEPEKNFNRVLTNFCMFGMDACENQKCHGWDFPFAVFVCLFVYILLIWLGDLIRPQFNQGCTSFHRKKEREKDNHCDIDLESFLASVRLQFCLRRRSNK